MSQSQRFPVKLGFASIYGPCDKAELSRWEATLPQGKLPEDYRQFLLEWNGGEFKEPRLLEDSLLAIGYSAISDQLDGEEFDGDANDAGIIEQLAGLFDPESIYDVRRSSVAHGFRGGVPDRYLSIGGTSTNTSQPCISVDGDDFGAIYHWCGEPWRIEPEPTTEYLFPVAPDFATFWKMIQFVEFD